MGIAPRGKRLAKALSKRVYNSILKRVSVGALAIMSCSAWLSLLMRELPVYCHTGLEQIAAAVRQEGSSPSIWCT
eukprot:5602406-Amphidinium_carterae.1